MHRAVFAVLLLVAVAGCAPHHYGRRHEMNDREAWDIVRGDPCRYDEYRRFADDHKNPEKRQREVWRLAHEGCSSERRYESRPPYDGDDRR